MKDHVLIMLWNIFGVRNFLFLYFYFRKVVRMVDAHMVREMNHLMQNLNLKILFSQEVNIAYFRSHFTFAYELPLASFCYFIHDYFVTCTSCMMFSSLISILFFFWHLGLIIWPDLWLNALLYRSNWTFLLK